MLNSIDVLRFIVRGWPSNDDLEVLKNDYFKDCIFVFDDTEGYEKGAANQALVNAMFSNRYYIYPASSELLARHDLKGFASLSVSFPMNRLVFTRQG